MPAFALLSPALVARPARLAARRPARRAPVGVRAGSGDLDRVAAIEDEISRQRAQIAEQRSSIARQRSALESVQSSVGARAVLRAPAGRAWRRASSPTAGCACGASWAVAATMCGPNA